MPKVTVNAPKGQKVIDYRQPLPGERTLDNFHDYLGRGFILDADPWYPPEQWCIGLEGYFSDKGSDERVYGTLAGRQGGWWYVDQDGKRWECFELEDKTWNWEIEVPNPPGYRVVRYGVPEEGDLVVGHDKIKKWSGSAMGYEYLIVERAPLSEEDFGNLVFTEDQEVGHLVEISDLQPHRYAVRTLDGRIHRTTKVYPCPVY